MQLALKERILKSSSVSLPTSTYLKGYESVRPGTYKSWTESKLYKAFEAVQNGMSIRRAAESFAVPRSTLQDRISGRTTFGVKRGPPRYLTYEEEDELICYLLGCAKMGYAKSKQEVISIVRKVVASKGKNIGIVTDGWWASFKKRHEELTLRSSESLAYVRAISTSAKVIEQYYDELETTLLENDQMDKPCQIYNFDETGMRFDPNPLNVITEKGVKHATCITSGDKTQITVVGCCSAGVGLYHLLSFMTGNRLSLNGPKERFWHCLWIVQEWMD